MLSSLCKFSLTLILNWLARSAIPARGRILPPPRPALPAAPTKSAAPTIDLTPDQVEQLAVAEEVIKIQALHFEATPVVAPDPAPVKIVSWTDLPESAGTGNESRNISHSETTSHEPQAITPTRGQLVEGLLDEGWQQGLRTYAQLMKYIELQTGTACSKRVVSAWKKSRQLTEVEAA